MRIRPLLRKCGIDILDVKICLILLSTFCICLFYSFFFFNQLYIIENAVRSKSVVLLIYMTDFVSLGSEKETANSAAVSLFPDSELTCSDNAVQLACKTENKNNLKKTDSTASGQSEKSESQTDKNTSFNENSTLKETKLISLQLDQSFASNSMSLRSSPRKCFTVVSSQFSTPEKKRKETFGFSPTKQVISIYYLIGPSRKPDPSQTFEKNKI